LKQTWSKTVAKPDKEKSPPYPPFKETTSVSVSELNNFKYNPETEIPKEGVQGEDAKRPPMVNFLVPFEPKKISDFKGRETIYDPAVDVLSLCMAFEDDFDSVFAKNTFRKFLLLIDDGKARIIIEKVWDGMREGGLKHPQRRLVKLLREAANRLAPVKDGKG
jgi:hypothetical protein